MAHQFEQSAADVSPPAKYTANLPGSGTLELATAATAQNVLMPDAWRGRYVIIQALTLDVNYAFGSTTTDTLVVDQVSTIDGTTKAITFSADTGLTLVAGTSREFRLPKATDSGVTDYYKYLVFRSTGTTGFFKMGLAENLRP